MARGQNTANHPSRRVGVERFSSPGSAGRGRITHIAGAGSQYERFEGHAGRGLTMNSSGEFTIGRPTSSFSAALDARSREYADVRSGKMSDADARRVGINPAKVRR